MGNVARLSGFIGKFAEVSTGIYSRGTETNHQTNSIHTLGPVGLVPVER